MTKFGRGKHSYAISDRSGFRYLYRDMRKEWNGLLVGPDEYESKQPQLGPFRTVSDAQALKDARPQNPDLNTPFLVKTTNGIFSGAKAELPSSIDNLEALVAGIGSVVIPDANPTYDTQSYVMTGSVGSVEINDENSASVTGIAGTSAVGTVTITNDNTASITGLAGTSAVGSVTITANITTYAVTVATGTNSYGTGNKFYIDGSVSPTLNLSEGSTYRFDQSDSSNSTHPLRFSTTANGSHGGGSEYTTGVSTNGTPGSSGAYTQITVASGAPTLYYYCTNHSGMGGQANTP